MTAIAIRLLKQTSTIAAAIMLACSLTPGPASAQADRARYPEAALTGAIIGGIIGGGKGAAAAVPAIGAGARRGRRRDSRLDQNAKRQRLFNGGAAAGAPISSTDTQSRATAAAWL